MSHEPSDRPRRDARPTGSDHESDTSCPRCGYSQRGIVASWRDACPLAGRCAECGLDFVWSELLRPNLHEPRWCVEYAPRRRLLLLAGTWFVNPGLAIAISEGILP